MAGIDENSEFSGKPKSTIFNRSLTIHATTNEFPQKLYNQSSMERNGSIKKLYSSSFGSVVSAGNSIKGKVKKLCSIFETKSPTSVLGDSQTQLPSPNKLISMKSLDSNSRVLSLPECPSIRLPGTEDRIVVYFTSLRGIRRTFEDCYAVRMILRGFRVFVDERDISMDSAYKKELLSVLGLKNVTLPQVFIRGRYIGDAESIKQLHETGELAKILKGLPFRAPGFVCESCGDARFMPCLDCNGSRKVYDEDEDQLKRCLECNENGLIRCPTCCS